MGFLMVSGRANNEPSNERVFCCIMMYVLGIVKMISTDVQKYVRLSLKKGLIDDLALAKNRNTNFLGEMLLYWSFATLTNEYLGYLVLIVVWSTLFVSRIWLKERSLMKKEGYKMYAEKSYLLVFKFFKSDLMNLVCYALSIIVGYLIYNNGGIEATVKSLNKFRN
jgi:steroid 5-alpha reductase family enzyme